MTIVNFKCCGNCNWNQADIVSEKDRIEKCRMNMHPDNSGKCCYLWMYDNKDIFDRQIIN